MIIIKKLYITTLAGIVAVAALAQENKNYEAMKNINHYGLNNIQEKEQWKHWYADSNGLEITIQEHYGGITKDTGTALLQNDNEYCIVYKNKPSRIIPKSRWSCYANKLKE